MGKLLLDEGLITQAQFNEARDLVHTGSGLTIEEALVKLGYLLDDVIEVYSTLSEVNKTGVSKKTNKGIQGALRAARLVTDKHAHSFDNFATAIGT